MRIRIVFRKGGLTMIDTLSVLTQHNDNGRTGQNLQEVLLNTTNVNQDEFGKLFTRHVDGHIYAQPLYLSNVPIPNKGTHNVVYVATMHNSVYAFDADDPHAAEPLWKASLGPSVPLSDPNIGPRNNLLPTLKPLLKLLVKNPLSFFSISKEAWLSALRPIWEEFREAWEQGLPALLALMGGFNNISVEVGILSTPVISLTHNALYVVTLTKVENIYAHHLHALDLTTGADKFGGPVQLEASIPGTGIGSVNGKVAFISYRQIQRAALLLANDVVYIAFASYGDQ